jgi:hypothetical protein
MYTIRAARFRATRQGTEIPGLGLLVLVPVTSTGTRRVPSFYFVTLSWDNVYFFSSSTIS